jgi:trigger factor
LSAGDTKKFMLTAPADYYEPSLAGKQMEFAVTMRRVQTVMKPAADDAFAKSLGKFEDLEQLKKSLRDGLLADKKTKEHQRIRLAILDAIIAATQVPAPEMMVKDELNDMIHRFGHDLQHRGIELGMYLARMKKTEDDLRRDWKPEAERQVRITLILHATAKQHTITVPSDELDAALNETVAQLIRQGQASEEQMDPQQLRMALYERMLADRTLELLERSCATE